MGGEGAHSLPKKWHRRSCLWSKGALLASCPRPATRSGDDSIAGLWDLRGRAPVPGRCGCDVPATGWPTHGRRPDQSCQCASLGVARPVCVAAPKAGSSWELGVMVVDGH
jgi:hypothetical protein